MHQQPTLPKERGFSLWVQYSDAPRREQSRPAASQQPDQGRRPSLGTPDGHQAMREAQAPSASLAVPVRPAGRKPGRACHNQVDHQAKYQAPVPSTQANFSRGDSATPSVPAGDSLSTFPQRSSDSRSRRRRAPVDSGPAQSSLASHALRPSRPSPWPFSQPHQREARPRQSPTSLRKQRRPRYEVAVVSQWTPPRRSSARTESYCPRPCSHSPDGIPRERRAGGGWCPQEKAKSRGTQVSPDPAGVRPGGHSP